MTATWLIIAESVRSTLLAEPDIVTLVAAKVFRERVLEGVDLEYITIHHISGGDENTAQTAYADAIVKVVGTTSNPAKIEPLMNAISKALKGKDTVLTASAASYATTEEVIPLEDAYQVQNTVFHVVGGMYRFRLQIL